MNRAVGFLVVGIVALAALDSAGPALVGLFNVMLSLVLAIGLATALLRLVWFVTTRHSS